jgi:hypothetical protein
VPAGRRLEVQCWATPVATPGSVPRLCRGNAIDIQLLQANCVCLMPDIKRSLDTDSHGMLHRRYWRTPRGARIWCGRAGIISFGACPGPPGCIERSSI